MVQYMCIYLENKEMTKTKYVERIYSSKNKYTRI